MAPILCVNESNHLWCMLFTWQPSSTIAELLDPPKKGEPTVEGSTNSFFWLEIELKIEDGNIR